MSSFRRLSFGAHRAKKDARNRLSNSAFFLMFVSTFVFAGCSADTTQLAISNTPQAIETQPTLPKLAERKLTDDSYVTLTAEVLCLPRQHPKAGEDELNTEAAKLFGKYRVSEQAYEIYQAEIKKDTIRSQNLSYQIVGQMQDVCGGSV